eukprot:c25008_g1_i1 orf=303-1460(-)
MADNLRGRFGALSVRFKTGGAEVGRKMSAGMSTMSDKMKGLFQAHTQADRIVQDLTAETVDTPNWSRIMELVDWLNEGKMNGQDVVKAIKRRIMTKSSKVQFLALILLETSVKNCEKMFSVVASEHILDEMVKLIEDPQTSTGNRDKVLKMIEAWGESTEELSYLPVYEETYKSLRSRGVMFPGRDPESLAPIFTPHSATISGMHSEEIPGAHGEMSAVQIKETFDIARNCVELLSTVLTSSPQQDVLHEELTGSLVEQCRQLQFTARRVVECAGDNDQLLFEALNVNDELQKVLEKYEKMLTSFGPPATQSSEPAIVALAAVSEEDHATGGVEEGLVRIHSSKPPNICQDQGSKATEDLDRRAFEEVSSNLGERKMSSDDLIVL